MSEQSQTDLIARTVKRVQAILGEAGVTPRTGRTLPDVGRVPEDATIASLIDHTLLSADATAREIEALCFDAKTYGFASVCVNSVYVPLAAQLLDDSGVTICTVTGFPLGASWSQVKVEEARLAIEAGAKQVTMAPHIGALKGRDLVALFEDISDVVYISHEADALCKVIVETSLLTQEEIIIASQIARMTGADFVQTGSGFGETAITIEDVSLIRDVVGEGVGVEASGSILDLATAQAMIAAGANRIGTRAGVSIAQAEEVIAG